MYGIKVTFAAEIREYHKRLRWLGQLMRVEDSRIPHQVIQWKIRGYKKKLGWPRKTGWTSIIR